VWTSGSLLLALSLGVPVVAAAISPYEELLGRGEAGWLWQPGDVESLRDALRAAAADPVVARAKGAAALRRAGALPSWAQIAAQTAALMAQARHGSPASAVIPQSPKPLP
jgi:glycosyltransferase involved in cell wall biosynthesis